ncbi:MAG: serine/threonine protein kinase [Clostridia bacterium]|nr:serine/threonine protein kinase [Clostridia bacterium]
MSAYDSFIGQTFEGRYTIINVTGIGGMATVYGAYDQLTGKSVAIKMMNKKLEHNARQIKLFVNESTALSLLSHPNIVQVYNTVITNSTKYIIMEYVEGITLKKHIDHRGALAEREVLYYATQILSALDYIHSKDIVHCDIKPQNIILLQNGSIKVADFGIARLDAMLDRSKERSETALGTVYYVSPEQAQGKAPKPESDLYSLGVMLYEAMTNRLPFYHENPNEVAKMQISKEPTPPSVYRHDISVGLEQIILRAMEKNPKKRYANAMEMLTDIRALRQNSKTVFGNEKNFSRYRIIERKPHSNASNVSNRSIYPVSERGANFADNQAYFKRNTSHSGTFRPSSQQFPSQTGRTAAQNSKTIAITSSNPAAAKTQRLPSGAIPPMHSQKLPPASNTVAIEDKQINKDIKETKWIKLLLGVICALIIIIVISCIIWFHLNKSENDKRPLSNQAYNTETETEWNTEHTEKF